jgi:hypothetical protein
MPDYFYRADYLTPALSVDGDQQSRIIEKSKVNLYYSDGFPTTRTGSLFWDKLDHEGSADFMMFQKYLDMSSTYGYRSIHVLAKSLSAEHYKPKVSGNSNVFLDVELYTPTNAVTNQEEQAHATQEHLRALYVFNFWRERSTSFDLVGYAAARRIREQRALALEDRQFIKLSGFVDRVFKRVDSFGEDDFDAITPDVAVKMLKDLIGLQRISIGLPANAPSSDHLPGQRDSDASTSVEDHLRVVAKKREAAINSIDAATLLGDEATATAAQELMMLMLRGKQA